MKKETKSNEPTYEVNVIRAYIAALIQDDGAKTQDLSLYPDLLPDEVAALHPTEAEVLRQMADLFDEGVPVTRAGLIARFVIRRNAGESIATDVIEEILSHQTVVSAPSVLRSNIKDYRDSLRTKRAMEEVSRIMQDRTTDYIDRFDEAMRVMAECRPDDTAAILFSPSQLLKSYRSLQAERVELRRAGKTIGFELPFKASATFLERLNPGELTLLMGKTGTGKTQLSDYIAERNAHEVGGCDVVHITTETPVEVLQDRYYARGMFVSYKKLAAGVDLSEESTAKLFRDFEEKVRRLSNEKGMLYRLDALGATMPDIVINMTRASRLSALANRKILFVLDILNEVAPPNAGRMSNQYSYIPEAARMFRNAIKRINRYTPAHGIIIAHSSGEEGSEEVFGSREVKKLTQLGLIIERQEFDTGAESDRPMLTNKGKQVVDNFGDDVFWYRKGSKSSEKMKLRSIKSNYGPSGVVRLLSLPSHARFYDDDSQIVEMVAAGLL